MTARPLFLGAAAAAILAAAPAIAQDTTTPQPAPPPAESIQPQDGETGQRQASTGTADSQCLQQLQSQSDRMRQDGYWLSGWNYTADPAALGGAGMAGDTPATMPAPGADVTGAPARDATTGQPVATTGETGAVTATPSTMAAADVETPWGRVDWSQRPRFEIATLFDAAVVLANRGNEDGCNAVVASIERIYGEYRAQLEELGVQPDQITSWRQEQIVLSTPVTEYQGSIRIDDVVDSDLRNPEDESLGEIDDVVVDPRSGQIRYAVVERGGFLGIGRDRHLVPWEQLRVTPGLNTFVLPVPEEAMENAPKLERGSGREVYAEANRYWQERVGSGGGQPAEPQVEPAPAQ